MTTIIEEIPSMQATTKASTRAQARPAWLTWPGISLVTAAILLAISNLYEFWHLTLNAPQYPEGLKVTLFTHKLEGDVREVDGLNHYIGMMPLGDAAGFERGIAMFVMGAFVVMAIGAGLLAARKSAWLALPIVLFPIAFVADLYYWLWKAGHDLDPTAALSSSITEFTPTILGRGVVGQFTTNATFGLGFWLAAAAAILALAGIVGRLREKPAKAV